LQGCTHRLHWSQRERNRQTDQGSLDICGQTEREREKERERGREREKEGGRDRERVSQKEGEREREREKCRICPELLFLILKE
jgi:hypothetical protein